MFGYVVGALGLIALLRVAHGFRHGWRCSGAYRWHGGFGHGGFGHHHRHWRERGRYGRPGGFRRWALYSLFERLDATPGQEKVIAAALDELKAKLRKGREEWSHSKGKVADALRGDQLTEEQASELSAPFASLFDEMRASMGEAMRKIHEALDERQRAILADIVDSGCGWHRGTC